MMLNFEIPDPVIDYIADKVKSNIRQLEGVTKNFTLIATLIKTHLLLHLLKILLRLLWKIHNRFPLQFKNC